MSRRRRWDEDARGIGEADARSWAPLVETLATAVDEEGWVAEEPELHLLPHLAAATAAGPLAIRGSGTDADGTFVVDLDWVGPGEASRLAIRSGLYGLIATIAETVTVLHEPPDAKGRVLEMLFGSAGGGGPFAGHGHTLRFRVTVPDRL
ncbi:MAG TPA: hypothetical protein VID95_04085 [Candidatus Limnocylindrales bacterium]